jgi:alkanesulfonate monooxygenase SsuD/methylene tetrahydromethanopterin reductase-like flavin-dependent oxidoreductase (luciferase family)|tara:strand:- start:1107 stop:2150 length:1044 start_codon:yes stop_codon:yes gene_type:complete
MKFSVQLSCDYPDPAYGGKKLYAEMIEQAVLADRLGFDAVSITEHHLINLLMMPAPLQFAVKIAAVTERVKIILGVAVLPLHDMRMYAGELVCADIFTDHRLLVGLGRGAFPFETARMGIPIDETLEKFDESVAVLQALLTEEEVSWCGKYYQFEPLTVMPRPDREIPFLMSAVRPEAIYHSTRKGFHIMTTPLAGDHQYLLDQVDAFDRGKSELGSAGEELTLSLSRVSFLVKDEADRRAKNTIAHRYYGRFDNIRGSGEIHHGVISPLPRKVPIEETAENLLVCTPSEMIDKLKVYESIGVDRFILNINFGNPQAEMLECIENFAAQVMPHFVADPEPAAVRQVI